MAGRPWRAIRHELVRVRWPLAGLAALAVVLACVFVIPRSLVQWELGASGDTLTGADRAKAINDIRGTLLQGIGGAVLLLGAYFTWRQLQVAREGQVTERFTRAIDQLGHAQLDVRLGGIYALERIANDSPDDRATIAEVLSAFVRSHAPWPPRLPGQYLANVPIDKVPELQERAPDVQAALTVLTRRPRPPKPDRGLDLHATDLRRTVLASADLQEANLRDANLQKAELSEAQLKGARFYDADLRDALLRGAQLQGAYLDGADLRGAGLSGAKLQNAHLAGAKLQGRRTTLIGVDLRDAILSDAQLQGAYLLNAQLQEAILSDANLQRATLRGANLQGAELEGTRLQSADLAGANLEAELRGAKLNNAEADSTTIWPKGFDLHHAGVVLIDRRADTADEPES